MSRLTWDGMAEPIATGENTFSPVQLTTGRVGSRTRLIHTLLKALTIHTYILPGTD